MPHGINEQEAISKAIQVLLSNALIGTISPACAGVREIMEKEVKFRLDPDGQEPGNDPKPGDYQWQVLDDGLWKTFITLVSMREIGMIPTISL